MDFNLKITLTSIAAATAIGLLLFKTRKTSGKRLIASFKRKYSKDDIVLCTLGQQTKYPPSSPAVCKLHAFLKMNDIKFKTYIISLSTLSPSGKTPFIYHDGQLITDSHFIIQYLVDQGFATHPDDWMSAKDRAVSNRLLIILKSSVSNLH